MSVISASSKYPLCADEGEVSDSKPSKPAFSAAGSPGYRASTPIADSYRNVAHMVSGEAISCISEGSCH